MHSNARGWITAGAGSLLAAALLSGCAPGATPGHDTASVAPSGAAAHFAMQDESVSNAYPDNTPAKTFEGTDSATVTVPAPATGDEKQLVVILNCTSDGSYRVTLDQADPKSTGSRCVSDTVVGFAAIPLQDPTAGQTLHIDVPPGSRYWLSTYYLAR